VPAAASCSELAAVLPEPPSPTTLHALALCGEPGHRERFRRSDTPPSAVLLWGTSMAYRAEAIPGFVYDAAVRLAPSDSGWGDLGELMDLTCETDRPDLAPQLRAILAASPPSTRDGLAARCPHQTDPEIARLFRRACGDCEIPPDPLEDPDGAVRSTWWLPGLFTRYPQYRSAFLEALARCAQDPDEPAAAPCLEALAEEDWATAAQVSANLAPSAERPMAEVQETLARFGSQADLKRHLHGIGLLTSDSAPPACSPSSAITSN
jgi:hypothetical protein